MFANKVTDHKMPVDQMSVDKMLFKKTSFFSSYDVN
jgi:hypothetical protein